MASEKMEGSSEMIKKSRWIWEDMRTAIFYDRNFEWTSPFFQLEILTWLPIINDGWGSWAATAASPRWKIRSSWGFLKPPSTGHLSGHLEKAKHCFGASRWCPLQLQIGYKAINYRYITNKNHSYWSYVHQLSYLGGTTLFNSASKACRNRVSSHRWSQNDPILGGIQES